MRLTMRLFGGFSVTRDGVSVPGLHLREGERLLTYLALHHSTPMTYRTLAGLFWPSEARNESGEFPSTRQVIYSLRQHLGDDAGMLTSVGKGVVQLNLDGVDCDLLAFDTHAVSPEPQDWQKALVLAEAPLLEGWSEVWVVEARQRRARIAQRLRERTSATSPTETVALETTGGAVLPGSRFYIERPADREFAEAIARRDSIVLVKGPRQIGKTSLLARGLEQARQQGTRVVLTDIQALPETCLATPDVFFRFLARTLALELEIPFHPADDWPEDLPPQTNLEMFLQSRILAADPSPVIWALDETDRLLSSPFASDIFGIFRSWHNRRALKPTSSWSRLTLAIGYATEAHLFILDANQSPFNVGTRATLSDFTLSQLAELNQRYGSPLATQSSLERVHALTAGHPYLTRCCLDALTSRTATLEHLESEGSRDEGPFGDHLRRFLSGVHASPELAASLRTLLSGTPRVPIDHFYRLRSAGIIAGESADAVSLRCRLYQDYFARHLNS
nr:AAA-like domain-containing protein [Armatimonas sp.]